MSAFCHLTDVDHGGASGEDVMADQVGSPERLMEVTSQPLPTATLHIRDPKGALLTEGALYSQEPAGASYRGSRCLRRPRFSSPLLETRNL